jgi:hypothetical protein
MRARLLNNGYNINDDAKKAQDVTSIKELSKLEKNLKFIHI